MAVTSILVPAAPSALFIITNTDTDETDDLAYSGSKTLKQIKINNSANTTVLYLQLWDDNNPASVTPGTTEPQAVFFCPASSTISYVFPGGLAFATGIVMAGTTNLAAPTYTPGAPASAVTTTLLVG